MRIAGKSKKFRATRPAHGIMVTLTNTQGWYLRTLVNTATKSDTDAYPLRSASQRVWFLGLLGLKTGLHFARFGLESGLK